MERRRGEKIKAKGAFRDAVRSRKKYPLISFGLRWVCMMLLLAVPWSSRGWALPFLTVRAPSAATNTAILYHDKPGELARQRGLSTEVKLVCDVDHLWSFTHENFWQDTVRKGIAPAAYLKNLEADLDGYFVTEPGRQKARRLLEARRAEVRLWEVSSAKTGL